MPTGECLVPTRPTHIAAFGLFKHAGGQAAPEREHRDDGGARQPQGRDDRRRSPHQRGRLAAQRVRKAHNSNLIQFCPAPHLDEGWLTQLCVWLPRILVGSFITTSPLHRSGQSVSTGTTRYVTRHDANGIGAFLDVPIRDLTSIVSFTVDYLAGTPHVETAGLRRGLLWVWVWGRG